MIIIESQAEIRLTQTLEAIKDNLGIKRCIWLNLSSFSDLPPDIVKELVAKISDYITSDDCQLFQLFTNDLVIIGHALTREQRQKVHDLTSRALGHELEEDVIKLYELSLHWSYITVMVDDILQKKRQIALKQKQELENQKREKILNMTFDPAVIAKIQTLRNSRHTLEIMVVEDDAFSRQMVCNSLRKQYKVHTVGDGKDALTTYVLKAPDVLFLDIELPDINGHQVLERLIKMDPNLYAIMLSGNGDKENIMRAMQAGAKGFVAKPFSKEKLIQYIERSPSYQKKIA